MEQTVNEFIGEIADVIDKSLPVKFIVKSKNGRVRKFQFLQIDEDMDEVRLELKEISDK